MDIAAMNQRITIEHCTTAVDSIGNRLNTWTTYFTGYATVGGEESSVSGETETAGLTVEDGKCSFTLRWCSELANINTTAYRVSFGGNLYDITGINHLNYKKRSIKLMCQKCRR